MPESVEVYTDVDVEVSCLECGATLSKSKVSLGKTGIDIAVEAEPCKVCMDSAVEEELKNHGL